MSISKTAEKRGYVREETLRLFQDIVTFGYELTYATPKNVLNTELRQLFFSEMYCERPLLEEKLRAFCTSQGAGLGVVIGVQGSGKSTIVQVVQSQLDPSHFPFLLINFKAFYTDKLSWEPIGKWRKIVEDNLKQQITARFLDQDRIDKWFTHFLFEDPETRAMFKDELDEIHRLYQHDRFRAGSAYPNDEKQWFATQLPRFPNLATSIGRQLTLEHYFKAARLQTSNAIEQFVVVFDNVDRVERQRQADVYQIAEDLRATHTTSANIIITTRKETCHPPEEVCNAHPAPIMEIGLYGNRERDKSLLSPDQFEQILARRLTCFKSLSKGAEFTNNIIALSRSLKEEYSEIVLINVANQSIRDALHYHCAFVEYLLDQYPPDELYSRLCQRGGVGSFLISCLYGWVARHGAVLNHQSLNLVELLDECRRVHQYKGIAGCDLSYLLLVCLYNCHRRHAANPLVSELFARFAPLKYSPEKLRKALFDLWSLRELEFGNVLNIYQKHLPKVSADIRDDAECELNFRGETLIQRVSVSFTFINRLLFDKGHDDFYPIKERRAVDRYYEIGHLPRHAHWSCRFLFDLAFLHSLELHKIRTRYASADWYDRYAHDFCIDHDLQVQRIIDSHCGFLVKAIQYHGAHEGLEWTSGVRWAIDALTTLSGLYDTQLKLLTPESEHQKWVIDFSKIFTSIVANRINMSDVGRIHTLPEYQRDISKLL